MDTTVRRVKEATVIYLGGFDLPDRNAAALRAIGNAKALVELGYRVYVVGFQRKPGKVGVRRERQLAAGIHCLSINATRSGSIGRYPSHVDPRNAIRIVATVAKRTRVAAVVCYNYPSLAQLAIQLYCRVRGVRYVSDITEWNTNRGGGRMFDTFRVIDISLRVRILNRLADALITTSGTMTCYYRSQRQPIAEIPTLFDVRSLPKRVDTGALEEGRRFRLVFAGPGFQVSNGPVRADNLKDRIDRIVEVITAANVLGCRLILDVFGLTREEYARSFPAHEDLLNRTTNVVFHGRRSHTAVLETLVLADFTILFRDNKRSNNAGFPSKVAESISCGVPVVVNDIISLRPYRTNPHILTICDGPTERMAGALCEAITRYKRALAGGKLDRSAESFEMFDYRRFAPALAHIMSDKA